MISPQIITFDLFKSHPQLTCVFSTRRGGISTKEYESLNLGLRTGDREDFVLKNRQRFFSEIHVNQSQIAFSDQVHSSRIAYVSHPGVYLRSDALITDKSNIFLVIQTADCFPIFIYDTQNKIIAAVHAGWRGVLNNIIEKTIDMIIGRFTADPADFMAAMGPGLQKECFEIRRDLFAVVDKIYLTDHADPEIKYFDLEQMIYDKMIKCGFKSDNIFKSGICTKCDSANFYSYRRDKERSGRMFGLIGIRG
jgi:YfiH family protein